MTMTIHLRHQGRSMDLSAAQLGLDEVALRQATDDAVERALRDALARHFDVAPDRFDHHVIDRPTNGNLIVRPEAVYG